MRFDGLKPAEVREASEGRVAGTSGAVIDPNSAMHALVLVRVLGRCLASAQHDVEPEAKGPVGNGVFQIEA